MEDTEIGAWLRRRLTDAGGEDEARYVIRDAKEAGFSASAVRHTWARLRAAGAGTTFLTGFGADKRSVWIYGGGSK